MPGWIRGVAFAIMVVCASVIFVYRATSPSMMIKKYAILLPIMGVSTLVFLKKEKDW